MSTKRRDNLHHTLSITAADKIKYDFRAKFQAVWKCFSLSGRCEIQSGSTNLFSGQLIINTLTCLDDRSGATSGPKQNLHAIIAASMFRRAQHKTQCLLQLHIFHAVMQNWTFSEEVDF